MVDPKAMEAWFRLVTEAMQGTQQAQQALRSLSEMPRTPDAVARWMTRFMPAAAGTVKPERFEEWLEGWYKMLGVVPRSRYLEALERAEQLRTRLEEAEHTIQQLRSMIGMRGQEEEARRVLNLWEQSVTETLQAHAAWMRAVWPTQDGQRES
jgi:hypothetical protein